MKTRNLLISAFALALGVVVPSAIAQTLFDPSLTQDAVISSGGALAQPTAMAFIAPNDILVAEKSTGMVRRVIGGVLQGTNVLDLPVANNSERGLLGMALHPQFTTNQYVYLFFTRASADGGTLIDYRLERYTWSGSALTTATPILVLPAQPGDGPNHDGGTLRFGPPSAADNDKKLFLVIGDLNRNNQTENYAAGGAPDDTASIIRINPDGVTPTDGPFYAVPGANASLQRLYAYGVRNSFGMDFDPVTDVLWDTENGPNDYDEINRVAPAFNSGWEYIMGPESGSSLKGAPARIQFGGIGAYSDPEFSWLNTVAPTAIHFLRGAGLGSGYTNDCFAADFGGVLYHFEFATGARDSFALSGVLADGVKDPTDSDAQVRLGQGFGGITDLQTGPDGNLYVLSYGNGQIYRVRLVTTVGDWETYP